MREGTCIHWAGLLEPCCKAGVNYRETFGKQDGIMLRMPCIRFDVRPAHGRGTYIKHGEPTVRHEIDRRGETVIPCSKYQEPTAEQIEQSRIESDAWLKRSTLALQIAAEWRVKGRPSKDRYEVIECPICKGRLHLSQFACNGHVHGHCETKDCVRWME